MIRWWLNPDDRNTPVGESFASLDAVFALEGEAVAWAPLSTVTRVSVGDTRFYVKRYAGNGKNLSRSWFGLRGLIGPQRVNKEWQNLRRFAAWGIPTARLVAFGLERRFAYFLRGTLITEELRGTTDLARMAREADPRLQNRTWVASVARQIAVATRRMHAEGFVHNDLKWRNLLVDNAASPTVYFIDCPAGSHWWGVFLRYRIIKDLACLDKLGQYHLTRSQRLRFYLDYTGHAKLTPADKARIRKVVAFFRGRE